MYALMSGFSLSNYLVWFGIVNNGVLQMVAAEFGWGQAQTGEGHPSSHPSNRRLAERARRHICSDACGGWPGCSAAALLGAFTVGYVSARPDPLHLMRCSACCRCYSRQTKCCRT